MTFLLLHLSEAINMYFNFFVIYINVFLMLIGVLVPMGLFSGYFYMLRFKR